MGFSLSSRGSRPAIAALLCVFAGTAAIAQPAVHYQVDLPNRVHHEAEITATFSGIAAGEPLQVRMSRSSPGRYALHEFAKNVYNVRVFDGRGRPLVASRPDPYGWEVAGHNGTVRIQYTLFGDRTDGTYVGIDATHAHLNMPAAFAWARGMERAPIRATFAVPSGWRVATQLVPTAEPNTFSAPNLQYFMDSPTEIGPLTVREWEIGPEGRRQKIRLALHHTGTEQEVDAFASMARAVVAEEIAVFGEAPRFDFGTYTFIADYLPYASGDGMEHRNSTILTSTRPVGSGAIGNLGTLAHEFFHAWNVERIRPRSLEPFDFERANMSGELWFAEGFTSYYDDLILRRAGITGDSAFAQGLGGPVNAVLTAPGRHIFSPVEMSLQAPFVDAAASIDPHNRQNTFISYYTYGAALGLGLDLTLRQRRRGLTLDDYMRAVWRAHGSPERPYTLADLERVLGEVTGDAGFAADFFRRHIHGREAIDYGRLLGQAGFLLRKANPGRVRLGGSFEAAEGGVRITSGTLAGSPLYVAGATRGDLIRSLNGMAVTTVDALNARVAALTAGDTATLELDQRGGRRSVRVVMTEDPTLEVVRYEDAGRPVTPQMLAFRRSWLDSRQGR